MRIRHMFLIPKCRRESDLGLCTTSALAKKMRLRSADFRLVKSVFGRKNLSEVGTVN